MKASWAGVSAILAIGIVAGPVVAATAQDDTGGPSPMVRPDIRYADDDARQVLHVFGHEPDGRSRPAVVIIHGGRFVFGDPLKEEPLARRYHDQGYVAVLLGYRLLDGDTLEDGWPAQIEDAQQAMRWIRANADEYGLDRERICALGFSAGGHLAALLGSTDASVDAEPALDGISSRSRSPVTGT